MAAQTARPSGFRAFLRFLDISGYVEQVWEWGLGSLVATVVGLMWPADWPSWTVYSGALAGGLITVGMVHALTRQILPNVTRWRHPTVLVVSCSGGQRALVTVTCSGSPVGLDVRGRILKVAKTYNPQPQWVALNVNVIAHSVPTKNTLEDGDVGHIIVAEIWTNGFNRSGVKVFGANIDGIEAEVELMIKSRPQIPAGTLLRRFAIGDTAHGFIIVETTL